MTGRLTSTLTIDVAGSEIDVEVEFTCSPFVPEQGPTYASGGQPAEGGEIEVTDATVLIGKTRHPAAWLVDAITENQRAMDRLAEVAAESEDDDGDAAYDRMRDERDAA